MFLCRGRETDWSRLYFSCSFTLHLLAEKKLKDERRVKGRKQPRDQSSLRLGFYHWPVFIQPHPNVAFFDGMWLGDEDRRRNLILEKRPQLIDHLSSSRKSVAKVLFPG